MIKTGRTTGGRQRRAVWSVFTRGLCLRRIGVLAAKGIGALLGLTTGVVGMFSERDLARKIGFVGEIVKAGRGVRNHDRPRVLRFGRQDYPGRMALMRQNISGIWPVMEK